MNFGTKKTKLIAAGIGLLMTAALTIGGTFAWMTISKKPDVQDITVSVSNETILEIAQAYPDNYLTGPPEVGENDASKTRLIDGQTVEDQGVWGKLVDMTGQQIILQEPATFDESTATLSTIQFDRTGRTNGFQTLSMQPVDEHGIVYYTKTVKNGNYRGEDGKIYTATESGATDSDSRYTPPADVKCAGGVAVWMRCNQPTSEEILLKGLTITRSTDSAAGDDLMGVVVNTYHLEKDAATKKWEKENHQLKEGVLTPFNSYYARKTDQGYVCTIFAGGEEQQMQPGELYLVQIICYIEGNLENSADNTAVVASNIGESKRVKFDGIECRDVSYAAKVTAQENIKGQGGWFSQKPTLTIQLFGSSEDTEKDNIIIDYRLTTKDDPSTVLRQERFNAFDTLGQRQKRELELDDGTYLLTVMTAQTKDDGTIDDSMPKYYTVNIGDTSMVNTKEDSITVRVDTVKPVVHTSISDEDCTPECVHTEVDGYTYYNHSVRVVATATESNLAYFSLGGNNLTPATISEAEGTYRADRLYAKDGQYTVKTVVTDKAGNVNEPGLIDPGTGKKSDEVSFVIDKKSPVITSMKWGFVNEGGAAQILSAFTGSMFFSKAVKLQVETEDANISGLTLSGEGITNVSPDIKNADGIHMTATAELPVNFSGNVEITAYDKAGNVTTFTDVPIQISDKLPQTDVVQNGQTVAEGSDVHYSITYHLAPSGDNATHVTGFQYSYNGTDWADHDRYLSIPQGDGTESNVHFEVSKTSLPGDTVTIYCDDYSTASGNIYFRAVTDIISDEGSGNTGYLKGTPTGQITYRLKAAEPEKPAVSVSYTESAGTGEYTAAVPVNGEITYSLGGGDAYSLTVDHYQYSTDGSIWYPTGSSDMVRTEGTLTFSVTGDRQQYVTVSGADDTDYTGDSRIYFRTVSTKNASAEQTVHGAATDEYLFRIDNKAPVFTQKLYGRVNDEPLAGLLDDLTFGLLFEEKQKIQIVAQDPNIDSITCTELTSSSESPGQGKIMATVYAETTFSGTLTFTATDKAGNISTYTTPMLEGSDTY